MATRDQYVYDDNMEEITKAKTHIMFCDRCGEYNHSLPGVTNNLYSYEYFTHKGCGGTICISKTTTHEMLDTLSFEQKIALQQEISGSIREADDFDSERDARILEEVRLTIDRMNRGIPIYYPIYNFQTIKLSNPDGHPRCPMCNSLLVQPIRTKKRLFSVGLFGMASDTVGKSMECLSCKYKW